MNKNSHPTGLVLRRQGCLWTKTRRRDGSFNSRIVAQFCHAGTVEVYTTNTTGGPLRMNLREAQRQLRGFSEKSGDRHPVFLNNGGDATIR